MAALVFSFFLFLLALCGAIVGFGFVKRHPSLILIGGLFVMLLGAVVWSEGIRDDGSPTFTKTGDVVSLTSYATFTYENDNGLKLLCPSLLFGGVLIMVAGAFFMVTAWRGGEAGGWW